MTAPLDAPLAVVRLPAQPHDVDVHPARPLVAVGLVTGRVQVWSTTPAAAADGASPPPPSLATNLRASTAPTRAVAFSDDGAALYAADADGGLLAIDVETGAPTGRLATGGAAFSRAAPAAGLAPRRGVVTGDDAGAVALWDPGSRDPMALWLHAHDDYVGDVAPLPGTGCVASVGGDGVLRVLDAAAVAAGRGAASKKQSASDPDDDELTCVAVTDAGTRLAAGSAGGVLSLWSVGAARGCADRWPLPRPARGGGGRPAVASLAARSIGGSRTLLAGCDDGALRVLTVLPNGCAAVVESAHVGGGPPARRRGGAPSIERVRAGGGDDGPLVATVASACREVRLWDGEALFGAGDAARAAGRAGKKKRGGGGGAPARPGAASFFSDLL